MSHYKNQRKAMVFSYNLFHVEFFFFTFLFSFHFLTNSSSSSSSLFIFDSDFLDLPTRDIISLCFKIISAIIMLQSTQHSITITHSLHTPSIVEIHNPVNHHYATARTKFPRLRWKEEVSRRKSENPVLLFYAK